MWFSSIYYLTHTCRHSNQHNSTDLLSISSELIQVLVIVQYLTEMLQMLYNSWVLRYKSNINFLSVMTWEVLLQKTC